MLAARLAQAGYAMTGVDPSAGMLEILRSRTPGRRGGARASGTALPFADDGFDLVLSVATLHHIADPGDVRRTLAEMVRVARPGGRILVWDHNPRNPYWGRLMARVPQDTGEERLIPEAEVARRAARAAARRSCASDQLGLVPDFVPPRSAARGGGGGARRRADAADPPARRPQRGARRQAGLTTAVLATVAAHGAASSAGSAVAPRLADARRARPRSCWRRSSG